MVHRLFNFRLRRFSSIVEFDKTCGGSPALAMRLRRDVEQRMSHLADFPLGCAHPWKHKSSESDGL